jgi:hypothetical protein
MKSTIFRKVLSEEYIEVNKSVPDTIKYLSEIKSGTPYGDADIYLNCSEKGKIRVGYYIPSKTPKSPENMYSFYKVYGRVIEKDNKTYIKMQTVYKIGTVYLQYVLLLFAFLLIPMCLLAKIPVEKFNIFVFALILFCFYLVIAHSYTSISKQKKLGFSLIPAMEEKLKKSVETIELWD